MAVLNLSWHLVILLKCIVFQANSLITNEEIEKASAAAKHVRNPRAIPDPCFIPQPYYRKYNKYTGRYESNYQPWRTTTRRPWIPWTSRKNIFKGQPPLTPKRRPYRRRTWRPKKNGSVFKGVTRKDWDRKLNRPTIDPFGNTVTPRWMYWEWRKTWLQNRPPVFKTLEEQKPSSAELFAKRIHQKFIDRYIKPTQFAIFRTKSQMENPTIATIRPIPESALYFAPKHLQKVLAPDKSFGSGYKGKSFNSQTEFSSISSISKSDKAFSSSFLDDDISDGFWGTVSRKAPSKSSSESLTETSYTSSYSSEPSGDLHLSISYDETTKSPIEIMMKGLSF